jgi:hypothetical protein
MNFSRLHIVAVFLFLASFSIAADNPAKPEAVQNPPILPQQFAGWQMQGKAQTSQSATAADPTNAPVLKEYGFTDASLSTYTRDDGRTLNIRAARFTDASGAFGAYTFYLQPQMKKEQIGDQGASSGQRVLFYRGHILIDAQFSRESPMSGAELRELAGVLPRPVGNAVNLPSFLAFMPRQAYVTNTEKYAMGPLALNAMPAPISNDLVDFSSSPEVSLGKYSTSSGEATLMLISYPTPQLAAERLRQLDVANQQPQSGISTVEHVGKFFDKRTGPIVAIASGPISESDAKTLLGMVNYEANVTWNENTSFQQKRDINILLNILILCAILCALAVAAGIAFGGIRILVKRMFPDKFFDRPGQIEFISLQLSEVMMDVESAERRKASGPR